MTKSLDLYDHNLETHSKVQDAYSRGETVVGAVQATGTGKSYIGLQLTLDNSNKKVIWVTPLNAIIDHIEDIIVKEGFSRKVDFSNLSFLNYHKLATMSDEEIENLECDLLIIDEFHHLGAPVWGKKVNKLIDSHKDMKIFGMTAYTVRDRGTAYERDMANDNGQELFSNKIVSNYTLADAIVDGILPPPTYKTSVIEILDKEVKELEEKINSGVFTYDERREYEKYLRDVKNQVHKSTSIPDILKTNIRKDGKYIYFCPVNSVDNDNDMQTIKDKIYNDLLKIGFKEEDIVFYETTSFDEKNGKLNRDAFVNDLSLDKVDVSKKLRIMFVKNQYNEGTHVPGVDGVIFGRGTYSDIVFFEQMGRTLDVDKGNNIFRKQLELLDERNLIGLAKYRNLDVEEDMTKEELIDLLARPTVIDLAGNYEFISNLRDEIKDKVKERISRTKDPKELKRLYKIIRNMNIEIRDIDMLKTLQNMNSNVSNRQWDRMYELAKAYYKYHGNLDIPVDFIVEGYKEGQKVNLKIWINTQIQAYREGKLSDDRIHKLKKIGLSFSYKHSRLSWDEWYELAKAYYEKYGNLNVPDKYRVEEYEGEIKPNLGGWIYSQKRKYREGQLSKEQVEKLKKIHMVFENRSFSLTWDEWYELAKAYYEKNGNLDLLGNFKVEAPNGLGLVDLGNWVYFQRQAYKKGQLSSDKIEKLNNIKMSFNNKNRTLSWEEMYEIAVSFFEINNNIDLPTKYLVDDFKTGEKVDLGAWLCTQKSQYRKGELSDDRIKKLKNIGVIFTKKRSTLTWDEWYELAEAYYNYHGNLNVPYNLEFEGYENDKKTNLGGWIVVQKHAYNKGQLSNDRIEKLKRIGMNFENGNLTWDEWYELATLYFEENGNLDPPSSYMIEYKDKSVNLGRWIVRQKGYYRNGQLSDDKIEKLENIGMIWNKRKRRK